MEVFHQFRENLKGLKAEVVGISYIGYIGRGNIQNISDIQVGSSSGGGNCETSEYASEVSEDYNSVDGSTSEARLVKDIDKHKHKHRKKTYTNTWKVHFVFGICLNFEKAVHSRILHAKSTPACKNYASASSDCSD